MKIGLDTELIMKLTKALFTLLKMQNEWEKKVKKSRYCFTTSLLLKLLLMAHMCTHMHMCLHVYVCTYIYAMEYVWSSEDKFLESLLIWICGSESGHQAYTASTFTLWIYPGPTQNNWNQSCVIKMHTWKYTDQGSRGACL